MTKTIQPHSGDSTTKTGKEIHSDKPETSLNLNQLFYVFENLNKTCEALSRHQNEIKIKNLELNILNKYLEKKDEN